MSTVQGPVKGNYWDKRPIIEVFYDQMMESGSYKDKVDNVWQALLNYVFDGADNYSVTKGNRLDAKGKNIADIVVHKLLNETSNSGAAKRTVVPILLIECKRKGEESNSWEEPLKQLSRYLNAISEKYKGPLWGGLAIGPFARFYDWKLGKRSAEGEISDMKGTQGKIYHVHKDREEIQRLLLGIQEKIPW
ncbi:MAG: hypothetical protein M1817_004063 [Caeruleum heppii]|nr:MAG: hypothetical protein M1817_004063 [Caeruleum heppii]